MLRQGYVSPSHLALKFLRPFKMLVLMLVPEDLFPKTSLDLQRAQNRISQLYAPKPRVSTPNIIDNSGLPALNSVPET